MSAKRFTIPIVWPKDMPICELCGRPICEPGYCQHCADRLYPREVTVDILASKLINPGDLED